MWQGLSESDDPNIICILKSNEKGNKECKERSKIEEQIKSIRRRKIGYGTGD